MFRQSAELECFPERIKAAVQFHAPSAAFDLWTSGRGGSQHSFLSSSKRCIKTLACNISLAARCLHSSAN